MKKVIRAARENFVLRMQEIYRTPSKGWQVSQPSRSKLLKSIAARSSDRLYLGVDHQANWSSSGGRLTKGEIKYAKVSSWDPERPEPVFLDAFVLLVGTIACEIDVVQVDRWRSSANRLKQTALASVFLSSPCLRPRSRVTT
jgi:hypothetical protein